jgi:hypothetical protein
MKVQVLFDETGSVNAVLYPASQTGSSKGSSKAQPVAVLKPANRQRVETLELPAELEQLSPAELHSSIRVDLRGGIPRLIAKDK